MVSSITIHGIIGCFPCFAILPSIEGIGQSTKIGNISCTKNRIGNDEERILRCLTALGLLNERIKSRSFEQFLEKRPFGIVFQPIIDILRYRRKHLVDDKERGIGRRDVEIRNFRFGIHKIIAIIIERYRKAVAGCCRIGQHVIGKIDLRILVTRNGMVFYQQFGIIHVDRRNRRIVIFREISVYRLVIGDEKGVISGIEIDGTVQIGIFEKTHPLGIAVLFQPCSCRNLFGDRKSRILKIIVACRKHSYSHEQI